MIIIYFLYFKFNRKNNFPINFLNHWIFIRTIFMKTIQYNISKE